MQKQTSIIKKEFAPDTLGHLVEARYFYFDPSEQDDENLRLLCGGHEKCATDFHILRKRFPFFALVFIMKGKGYYTVNQTRHNLQYGSMVCMNPSAPYILEADKTNPMEQFIVIFQGETAHELYEKSDLYYRPVLSVSNPVSTANLFEELFETGFSKPRFAHNICTCLLRCIILRQAGTELNEMQVSESYQSFFLCKKYLEENFVHICSSSQLAEECSFDIRYIARLFKKYAGIRPYDYLMKLKTDNALNLLVTSNLSIKKIAFMSGFTDPGHFSRVFKKRFDLSPESYRKALSQ